MLRSYLGGIVAILALIAIISFLNSLEEIPSSVVNVVLAVAVIVGAVVGIFYWRRRAYGKRARRAAMLERLDHIRAGPRPPKEVSR